MRRPAVVIVAFLAYFLAAGLTSGFKLADDPECFRTYRKVELHDGRASASVSALLWPIYWPVLLGEELFGTRQRCLR